MTDCVGNNLEVGYNVVYIEKTYCTARLAKGTVSSIKKAIWKRHGFSQWMEQSDFIEHI